MDDKKWSPYLCHGIDLRKATKEEGVGTCPFCDKDDHFYVNRNTGQFSCKHCGEEGNTFTFLKRYSDLVYSETTKEEYRALAQLRGLPIKALRDWHLGWDGENWLLPVLSEKKTCRDVRRWNPKTKVMKSTAGCKAQFYGWYMAMRLPAGATIYICEGEWDAIALSWLLAQAGLTNARAVSAPGANTFKDEWAENLKNYRVVICYDNDIPGEQGTLKVYTKIKEFAKEIQILKWPASTPPKYDVRDYVREGFQEHLPAKQILKAFKKILAEPEEFPFLIDDEKQIDQQEEISDNPPSFQETLAVYQEWADMPPDLVDALKIMFAVILSTKVAGDPLWIYIVGPSGCGKTLLLLSLAESSQCIFRSCITAHNLVSGFRRTPDPSLLPKLNNRCCIWKDFTEILAHRDKEQIYSTLRGAYDGEVDASFGNGVERHYRHLHFSMLAGVTPAVHGDRQAMLGERFLKFEIFKNTEADTSKQIKAAMDMVGQEDEMNAALQEAAKAFLARPIEIPELPDWAEQRIVLLSRLASPLCAVVEREEYGERDIRYMPSPQMGTRMAKQLIKLACFIALVNGHQRVTYEDYRLVEKTALDTSRKMYIQILLAIMQTGKAAAIRDIADRTRMAYNTVARQIEDLRLLNVLQKAGQKTSGKSGGRPKVLWQIHPRLAGLFEQAKIGERPRLMARKKR